MSTKRYLIVLSIFQRLLSSTLQLGNWIVSLLSIFTCHNHSVRQYTDDLHEQICYWI